MKNNLLNRENTKTFFGYSGIKKEVVFDAKTWVDITAASMKSGYRADWNKFLEAVITERLKTLDHQPLAASPFLTYKEAEELTGLSKKTLQRAIKRRKLKPYGNPKGKRFLSKKQVEEWFSGNGKRPKRNKTAPKCDTP